VGYGAAQDRVIATSLRKYEALKPLAQHLKLYGDSLAVVSAGLHQTVAYQQSALRAADGIIVAKDVLYIDAHTKAQVWEKKAKSRWWLNVGLGALALLLGTAAVR
jgi:hypothetical protein